MNKILCEYGCGKIATYRFKNGKYCCSESVSRCDEIKRIKRKHGGPMKGKKHSQRTIELLKKISTGRKHTKETREKMSESQNFPKRKY